MCLGGDARGEIGARVEAPLKWAPGVPLAAALFGEAGGFVVEVPRLRTREFHEVCKRHGAWTVVLGGTGGSSLVVDGLMDVPLARIAQAWTATLTELFA
jgi:phosphoribosylformylglycinamidine synthase